MTDIIIVGAGTAGMTTAIYALRNNKSVLILESTSIGGQIAFSPKVENFPSYKEISGSELSQKLFEQVLSLGATFELEDVQGIEKQPNGTFIVKTADNEYKAKCVVLAAGVQQKRLGIEREENLLGKGVYYCAICDGAFYKGKEVALIGDGNTALQSALLLSSICSKVYMLTWFDKFFGDESLVTSLRQRKNIEVIPNTSVVDFIGEDKLEGLKVERKEDGTFFELNVSAVFVAIGQIPANERFKNLVKLDKDGYIISDEAMNTGVEGLYVAGDCRVKGVRQLTTAISDGAIAGMSAIAYLQKIEKL